MEESLVQQRARIYRLATLAAGAFVHLVACGIVLSIGYMSLSSVQFLALASLSGAGFMVLALLIILERNLTFEDPDMSLQQMLWAVSVVIVSTHFVTELKPAVLMFGLTLVVFCVNRLQNHEKVVFAVYSVALYMFSLFLAPAESFAWITEIVVLIAFGMIVVFVPMLYRFEMSMIEEVLVDKNQELTEALSRISELAVKDELTGAYNRRHLMEYLGQQKALADREKHPFTLCFVDLDFFKQVNDRFGHATGDDVLKQFSRISEGVLREVDCVGRLGGEEFLLVLSGTTQEYALTAAKRLAEALKQMKVSSNEPHYRVTASMGITEYREGEEVATTVERADKALYDAKRTGRNRVVIADQTAQQISFQ